VEGPSRARRLALENGLDGLDGPRRCRPCYLKGLQLACGWRVFPSLHPPTSVSLIPIAPMSSSLNQSISRLKFHDLFDSALKEYNQKTGIDIVTDPLIATLLDCDSSDEVLDVLQEQAHAFSQYQNGDGAVQLTRQLKPTVDILLGLSSSGVFGKGFGLVRLMKSICFYGCSYNLAEIFTSKDDIHRFWSPTCGMSFLSPARAAVLTTKS
jgi:hypothetical protein